MERKHTIPDSFFESFWAAKEEEIKPEDRDFYENFLDKNDKIKAEITSYDFLEEYKKKYTVYNIKVTTDYFSYNIQKRFSLFLQLRNDLKDKYPELRLNHVTFPAKTYFSFGGTDIETIEKRRKLLNDFLLLLANNCKNSLIIEFLEFIEVKGRTELAFNNQTSYPFIEKQSTTNSQEIAKLIQYLDLLNKNSDDTSKILKEMETFFITSRPKLSQDIIATLLIGKPNSKGLLHFCGKREQNSSLHLVCGVGLEFLATLMDYQKCQDAEQFITIFSSCELSEIALLNLNEHTEPMNKSACKSYALKLLDIFLNRNPNLTASDILKKSSSIQEYNLWKLKNKTNSILAERYEISPKPAEIKEVSDFSLSPQGSSINSLDEFSNYAEKLFPVGKLDWCDLYKDEDIKIRYCRSKYLSITLRSSQDLETCYGKLSKGIDYRILCDESKVVREIDVDTKLHMIKVNFMYEEYNHLVFMSERRIEERINDRIAILERPCKKYSVMLNASELLVKRFSNTVIKFDYKAKGKPTKIKMLIKNTDNGSRSLQDYLIKEGGKLIVESCRKFLEDVEK